MKNKIAIIGLGAIGSVLSKLLISNQNNSISFYTRTPKNTIQIEFQGHHFSHPIHCESKPFQPNNFDWIILTLKEHQILSAIPLIHKILSKHTHIVVIRNGLDHESDLKDQIKHSSILPCLIDCSVQPNHKAGYTQLSSPIITLPESKTAKMFDKLFQTAEVKVDFAQDFKSQSWKKIIESASLGAIQCMTGKPCIIFKEPKYMDQYKRFIREGMIVAKADGAHIDHDFESHLLTKALNYPNEKGSSMLSDFIAGRTLELGAKNGSILKKAVEHDLKAPLNELFCRQMENKNAI